MKYKLVLGFIFILNTLNGCCNGDGCTCTEMEMLTHCNCEGNIEQLPSNLANGTVHILSISYGTMKNISSTTLTNYKDSLLELTIIRMKNFTHIDDGALDKIQHIKLLRIVHTLLRRLPKIRNLGNGRPLHTVDFESNMIESLESNNLEITAEQLFLDYNKITSVHGWAFKGSQIGKLSLRGNRFLKDLSKEAFSGLRSLRDLDLSETAIHFLPISGLEELEILRLTNTPTLKTIPSIHDLTKLKKAYLTHFFHCCAFHYPERHDPARHQKYLEAMEKFCPNSQQRVPRSAEDGFGHFWEDVDYNDNNYNFTITKGNYTEREDIWGEGDEEMKLKEEMFHNQSAELPTSRIHITCGNLTKRTENPQ